MSEKRYPNGDSGALDPVSNCRETVLERVSKPPYGTESASGKQALFSEYCPFGCLKRTSKQPKRGVLKHTLNKGFRAAVAEKSPSRRLNPRRYGSSVAAVAIEQSRTQQKIGAEQSHFFGLNERNLLTG